MTKNRKAKQAARAFAQTTGARYTAARRATGGGSAGGGGQTPWTPDDGWDDYEPTPLTDLVESAVQGLCDKLAGDGITPNGVTSADGIGVDFTLPRDMSEPLVRGLALEENSVDVQVDEGFEGGTLACNVTANGTLTVEALMIKQVAHSAAARGLVTIFDLDVDDDHSSVHFDVQIEMTLLAIVNPEYESVEDLRLDRALAIND